MALTRILNNQVTDASGANAYLGINAAAKLQNYSITSGKIANNLTYGSNLTITGNLDVQGATTTIDTYNVVIEDPLLLLAKDQTGSPTLDIGFIGERGTSDNIAFVWDESQGLFVTAFTDTAISNTTINITSYASFKTFDAEVTGNLAVTGTADFTGDVTFGNISTTGYINADGNISGGNLISNGSATITTTATVGNLSTAGTVSAAGNITGGNINSNASINGTTLTTTSTATVGNLSTAGVINATGNITGGNINSNAGIDGTTLTISSTATVGNLSTVGVINADGNITGGNIISNGILSTDTLETTGNALIGGNLIVQGNITYINIDDLRVEDPIIILGTGPNGAPLTVDDGMDRGIYMEYYTTGLGNAFMGWDNSTGNMIIANDVSFSGNNVVAVGSFGTLEVGNVYAESINSQGNIDGTIINMTGNVNAGNVNATSGRIAAATGYFTGNVDVLGNLNATVGVVYANSGIFLGDAVTGNNAAFAGIPGFTQLGSNVVMQFAGNVNSYSQLNFQNINNGSAASTDYIATADNGNDTTYYVNMGINSSTFDDASYAGYGPNDSYVHNHGGNLILNPETAGKDIQFMVGGTDASDVIANVNTSGLYVVSGNLYAPSITSTTGAVVVNEAGEDVNFRVEGDTDSNLFIVDAGSDTVLIGTATPVTGAALNIGTTNSMLIPVGNTLQRPNTGVTGMLRFNTTSDQLEYYDADGWTSAGTTFTVVVSDQFAGDDSTTDFTLSQDSSTAATIVSINGIVQIPTVAYSVSGNTLSFTEAPAVSDVIDARILTTTTTVTALQNAQGTAVFEAQDGAASFNITGNLLPSANVTYNLGSNTARFNELWLAGSTITLGTIVIKDAGSNQIGFFQADGTTPATIDSQNVDTTQIASGTSNMSVISSGGNIRANIGGSTVTTIYSGGIIVSGTTTATTFSGSGAALTNLNASNIASGTIGSSYVSGAYTGITSVGTLGSLSVTGNVSAGNLSGTNIVGTLTTASQTNITGVGALNAGSITSGFGAIDIGTDTVTCGGIINAGANGTGNIGSASTYFNTVFAKATSAQYADLAENYEADADYEPGTVVAFGGDKEVTISTTADDKRVAGVVSTNPSYLMNSGQEGQYVAAIALQGRVPCKVTGTVRKGDLMVSNGDGTAVANNDAGVGTVIGKALENFDGATGVIEVVVGRF